MAIKIERFLNKNFKFSIRGALITLFIFSISVCTCFLLKSFNYAIELKMLLLILSVLLVSVITEGYLYWVVSSLFFVLTINFIYTHHFFEFNFTMPGYLLAIICMIVISVLTSALKTQIKKNKSIKFEAEREKTISNLLRAVSHDIRTPLTSILGASSALIDNDDVLDKKERLKLLSEIKDDASWLIQMVENLLYITRINDENSAKITKQNEAGEEVIADSVSKFKNRFPESNVDIKIPDELMMIPMDAILIKQVIFNLLENAVVHSNGATKLELSLYSKDRNAVFEVSDNGCGINQNLLPHIFDGCFKQSDDNNIDKKKNIGIGLSVCYTIIKAHNGTMSAENKKSGGAVFRFTLPLEEK